MNKKILSLIIFAITFFFFTSTVKAWDFDITCNLNGCSDVPPIFNETGMHPGMSISKTLRVANDYPEDRSFALEIQNLKDSAPSMGDALTVTITDDQTGSLVYGPVTVTQWKNDGFLHLGNVGTGTNRVYKFAVDFANKGNDYQYQTLTFDMKMGFEELGAGISQTSTKNVLGIQTGIKKITQVLGIEAIGTPAPTTSPQVEGISTCINPATRWWLPLVIEALILGLYYFLTREKKIIFSRWILLPIIITIISQIVHERSGCSCGDSSWCSKYIWLNLGGLMITVILRIFGQKSLISKE